MPIGEICGTVVQKYQPKQRRLIHIIVGKSPKHNVFYCFYIVQEHCSEHSTFHAPDQSCRW